MNALPVACGEKKRVTSSSPRGSAALVSWFELHPAAIAAPSPPARVEAGTVPHAAGCVTHAGSAGGLQVIFADGTTVEAGGPAATAGLVEGDVIVSIDGVTIGADASPHDALLTHAPGDTSTLADWQAATSATTTVDVTLGTRP